MLIANPDAPLLPPPLLRSVLSSRGIPEGVDVPKGIVLKYAIVVPTPETADTNSIMNSIAAKDALGERRIRPGSF
jgi:hypothetical protein